MKAPHMMNMLNEAKWKTVYTLFSSILCFCTCFVYSDILLQHHLFLCSQSLPKSFGMFTSTSLTETFFVLIVICVYISIMCSFPVALYNIHTFLRPGRFFYETIFHLNYTVFTSVCVWNIYIFTMTFVLPLTLQFFLSMNTSWHHIPRISDYVFFSLWLCFCLQLVSQVPWIALYIAVFFSFSYSMFAKTRKYWYIFLLCVSALICPPDVWLQAFCWGTFILCFECLHIFICLGQLYGNELRFSYASQLTGKHNLTTKNSSNIL